jgi:hypothetical protein
MPENRPAHTVKDLTPGMSGYVRPSAIRTDDEGDYWLDPNAPVIMNRVMIQAFGEPPTPIKVMRGDEGHAFTCRRDEIEFDQAEESERVGFIPLMRLD